MAYSYLLKKARKQSKLSLRDAAAVFRLSPSTLNRYEEGVITHVPPKKLIMLLDHYGILPARIAAEWNRRAAIERLSLYEESQRRIDADFLFDRYQSLDERGKRNVLNLLLHETAVTAQLRSQNRRRPQ